MKQTLLTVVVLAASTSYVAFANGDVRARLARDIGIGAAGRPVGTIAPGDPAEGSPAGGPAVAPTPPVVSAAGVAAPMAPAPASSPPPDRAATDYGRLVGLDRLAYRSGDRHDDDEDDDDHHDHVADGAFASFVSPPAEPPAGDGSSKALAAPLPRPRPATAPQSNAAAAQADSGPPVPAAPQVAQAGLKNGTFRGPSEGAYYGRVQVAAVVSGGKLTNIEILDYPSDRRRSQRISQFALPALEQEAVSAQSADIDIVSGATLTSEAFVRSLDAALAKARS